MGAENFSPEAFEGKSLRQDSLESSVEQAETLFNQALDRVSDRPLDRHAWRVIESLSLNSFENILNAFEEFLSNIDLFEGEVSFKKAAGALDAASQSFAAIDTNHDFVMTRNELANYLGQDCHSANFTALSWLVANFSIFEQLSFFANGITRVEIETARDTFHGLNYLQENFEQVSVEQNGKHIISEKAISDHLHHCEPPLEKHDARGLRGLLHYLSRVQEILEHHGKKE